jgi:hypothetical protein
MSKYVRLQAGLIAALPTIAGAAANWYVTNTGTDIALCGTSRDRACRSISQAIENANDGDVIWVGAGIYGDLNGNGDFSDPGDEHPRNSPDYGNCVVCITKAVRIYSYNGTAATVIRGTDEFAAAVQVSRSGVVLGAKDHGFTLMGGSYAGVIFQYDVAGFGVQGQITVAGNIALHEQVGFAIEGPTLSMPIGCPDDVCVPKVHILLAQNTAIDCGVGFSAAQSLNFGTSPIVIRDNLALGGATGFVAGPGFQGAGTGEAYKRADMIQWIHNLASDTSVGFHGTSLGTIQNNVASANGQSGFVIDAAGFGTTFKQNAAVGNAGPGVVAGFFYDSVDSPDPKTSFFAAFAQNDFYGNDRNRPAMTVGYPGFDPGPAAHCGVLNVGVLKYPEAQPPIPNVDLNAANNFWGSPAGPASTGRADAVGGACDQNGGRTNASPYSPTWFPIVPPG